MENVIIETRHYYRIPYETTNTVKFKSMKPSSQVLYMSLCRIANDCADLEGWFYHSIQDLCVASGLEKKTVLLAKKELEKNHYIDVKRGTYISNKRRACNYYRINGFSFRKN
jgi:hypothetical protein